MITAADGQGRIRLITNSAAIFRPAVPVYYIAKYFLFWFIIQAWKILRFEIIKNTSRFLRILHSVYNIHTMDVSKTLTVIGR